MFDVLIIGGGVVGSAIARELSRYRLKIGVLEKNPDVCFETSGRNTGVCHGGFAYDIGSLKAKLCVEGNRGFEQLCRDLDIPFRNTGKILVAFDDEDLEILKGIIAQGEANGCKDLRLINADELKYVFHAHAHLHVRCFSHRGTALGHNIKAFVHGKTGLK